MWGKILAGAAVGVGAVAAAPFTGGGSLLGAATLASSLAGAGTVAAAAGVGVAGAAAGAAWAVSDEDNESRARNEGRNEGKAEMAAKFEALQSSLHDTLMALKEHDKHFNALIAMEAVGVACAACDGDFSDNERQEIGEFVKGMGEQSVPEKVRTKMEDIYNNPPSVREAFVLAEHSGVPMHIFVDLIKFVMEIDGIKQEEQEFLVAWGQLEEMSAA
jgi:uncharacterized membrane protein YebE (DUF533 family)